MGVDKLEALMNKLGANASAIHSEYVVWTIWSSVCWLVCGLIMIMGGYKAANHFKKQAEDDNLDEDYATVLKALMWMIAFSGVLIVFSNLPDLLSPSAKAWHFFINDLRGH